MDKTDTIVWQEGNTPASDGTLGLLVIKRYELFDCRDYKAFHEIRHEEENIRTYVGI